MKYNGNLSITSDNAHEYKELTEVTGALNVYSNTSLPRLTTVGGYLNVYLNASLEAPRLTTVGGYLDVWSNVSLPRLTHVGGALYVYSNASLEAPRLTHVGGALYVYSNASLEAPRLKHTDDLAALNRALARRKLILADGILSHVLSTKKRSSTTIMRVRHVGKTKSSYLVKRGDAYSHGSSLREAIADLAFKLAPQDTSAYKSWNVNTSAPLPKMVQAYRSITGACSEGVKRFVSQQSRMPRKLAVGAVIKLTEGQYGGEKFAEFFKDGGKE